MPDFDGKKVAAFMFGGDTLKRQMELDEEYYEEMKRKQQVRENFRQAVFGRDNGKCKVCYQPAVDAHHITDRTEMPNGGYVKENGISLCADCHLKAERFHITAGREWEPNMHPDDLYRKIGSSQEKARAASEKL